MNNKHSKHRPLKTSTSQSNLFLFLFLKKQGPQSWNIQNTFLHNHRTSPTSWCFANTSNRVSNAPKIAGAHLIKRIGKERPVEHGPRRISETGSLVWQLLFQRSIMLLHNMCSTTSYELESLQVAHMHFAEKQKGRFRQLCPFAQWPMTKICIFRCLAAVPPLRVQISTYSKKCGCWSRRHISRPHQCLRSQCEDVSVLALSTCDSCASNLPCARSSQSKFHRQLLPAGSLRKYEFWSNRFQKMLGMQSNKEDEGRKNVEDGAVDMTCLNEMA